ncbi:hypothetical protein G6F56_005433 [Rhizopus delemar]|nr:hypothetical protein G6F56_005433 [Rhizopus delemar]
MRLKGKKSYVLEEVCAFPFPVSLFGIRSGGIETLINGLSAIECLLLELERIYEEARNYEEDSIERVARGSKRPRKFLSKDWLTDAKMEEEE